MSAPQRGRDAIDLPTVAQLLTRIGRRQHARVGVPVTAASLAIAVAWLAVRKLAVPP